MSWRLGVEEMNYLSVADISKLWGISKRRVAVLCANGRLDGAIKLSGRWLIPENCRKPPDKRISCSDTNASLVEESIRNSNAHSFINYATSQNRASGSDENLQIIDLISPNRSIKCKIVAGYQGLKNRISSMNMMESPDIAHWALPGQFIVTTGYCIRDDVNVQKQVVVDLADNKCAGLGIKIMRFFRTIPAHMIDIANQRGLPLIELPSDCNISEFMHETMKNVYAKQMERIEQSFTLYKIFSNLAHKENALEEITQMLGDMLESSIIITDVDWCVACRSKASKFDTYECQLLPSTIKIKDEDQDEFGFILRDNVQVDGTTLFRHLYPLNFENMSYGYLVIISKDEVFSELDLLAIQHAGTLAALSMFKNYDAVHASTRKENYVFSLLRGTLLGSETVYKRGAFLGFYIDSFYTCVVVDIEQEKKHEIGQKIVRDLRQSYLLKRSNACILNYEDKVVILLNVHHVTGTWWQERGIEELMEEIILLAKATLEDCVIGVGSPYSLLELRKSYEEALKVIRLEKKRVHNFNQGVSFYPPNRAESLLVTLPQEEKLELRREILAKLEKYDDENDSGLVETLQTYFENDRNISQSARKLYIHRNTMIYRMKKIAEMSAIDFDDNNSLLLAQIAIKLYPFKD